MCPIDSLGSSQQLTQIQQIEKQNAEIQQYFNSDEIQKILGQQLATKFSEIGQQIIKLKTKLDALPKNEFHAAEDLLGKINKELVQASQLIVDAPISASFEKVGIKHGDADIKNLSKTNPVAAKKIMESTEKEFHNTKRISLIRFEDFSTKLLNQQMDILKKMTATHSDLSQINQAIQNAIRD